MRKTWFAWIGTLLAFSMIIPASAQDDLAGIRRDQERETGNSKDLGNPKKLDMQKYTGDPAQQPDPLRISDYVRRIFQDRDGNLWFGTNGDGVGRFDGTSFRTFQFDDGFGGTAVRGIVQDKQGNLWFGTDCGVTKFDGTKFTHLTEDDGLPHQDVWSILIDSQDVLWVGTLQGACRYRENKFELFELPEAEPDPNAGVTSSRMVRSIMEDSQGRIWFATNGGAYFFDGKSLTNLSETEGLCNNNVNCILEANDGTFWFATSHNGVCRYDGKTFTHFGREHGIVGHEAWDLFRDRDGNIWFPIENSGMYRFDGTTFKNYGREQGLASTAIQSTYQDQAGRIWFGGVFGLFRLEKNDFIIPITKQGPW